jgi:hypothetical protein
MKQITAIFNTYLKKTPDSASDLKEDQLIFVEKNRNYSVDKVLLEYGLHIQVKLSYGAGDWWVFKPHWDLSDLPNTLPVTAVFKFPVGRSPKLIEGILQFYRGDDIAIEVVATSGAIGYQYRGAEKIVGKGQIPEGNTWQINTKGYWLNTKGVEGMFFHITPDPYKGSGFSRSEIGLHRDANVPGSAGCIVVRNSQIFNNQIVGYLAGLSQEQKTVNLSVQYT